jgi:hypothetical protein
MEFHFTYTKEEMKEVRRKRKNEVDKIITDMMYGIHEMANGWLKESYQMDNLDFNKDETLDEIRKLLHSILFSKSELYDNNIIYETEYSEEDFI